MAPSLGAWDDEPSWPTSKQVLYVDAYDSFSYNVVAMLEETLNVRVTVMTIDSEWPWSNMIEFLRRFEAVVLGPGPGNPMMPKDVGIMQDIWNLPDEEPLPVFGICLGFQSLCLHHGIPIDRLPYPLHGQVRRISTAGRDIFEDVQNVEVTLYHSLYARLDDGAIKPPTSEDLDFLAWLCVDEEIQPVKTKIPMAVRHKKKPLWGVQFHPESCKSDKGACTRLLKKWWHSTLKFNKISRRVVHGNLHYTGDLALVKPQSAVKDFMPTKAVYDVGKYAPGFCGSQSNADLSGRDIPHTMLDWSKSASDNAGYRSFLSNNLTAEDICERLNGPLSPTVLFQSDGRYSIISVRSPGSWRLEYYAHLEKIVLRKQDDEENRAVSGDWLSVPQFWDAMRHLMERKRVGSGNRAVPFWGGFLGYFSYEMGLASLAHPKATEDYLRGHSHQSMDPPDVSLLWTERSIIVDNKTGDITIQSIREADDLKTEWLDQTLQQLQVLFDVDRPGENENTGADAEPLDFILKKSEIRFPNEQSYKQQVEACKAELEAGESYELCLTCETSVTLPSPIKPHNRARFPWELYKRLRKYNPAAFSAYAKLGNTKIVSSSPECFLTWDRKSTLEMKPMKGTVRKSDDMTMEKAKEILSSTKEMAENLMIADLIRHDLYGICGSGGVRVEKLLEVEDHGRVFQMITHVKGEIDRHNPGFAVRDMPQLNTSNMSVHGITALQKCLPPGSMTGAPKERSCMHLQSIENRKRGIYSGVMGYLDLGGGGSFSVLIRTAFTSSNEDDREQRWRIGAGGAVTTLSTADGEWDEMLTKLRTVCNIFTPLDSGKS